MRFQFVRRASAPVRFGAAIAFVAVTASHAAAAPITFDEATSVDLAFALPMGSPLASPVSTTASSRSGTICSARGSSVPFHTLQ